MKVKSINLNLVYPGPVYKYIKKCRACYFYVHKALTVVKYGVILTPRKQRGKVDIIRVRSDSKGEFPLAILTRVKISPQQRYDLEDLFADQAAQRTDAKLWTQKFLSESNLIMSGFAVTGIGLSSATVGMSGAAFIIPQNTTDFSYFVSAPAEPNVTIPDADLADNSRNYVEISLATQDGTPLTKAFWDAEANSGDGSEFNQIVNTVTDLKVSFVVSTGGFSGLPDRLPVAIIDTDNSGIIKVILDRRELFGRLAKPNNLDNEYAWGTKVDPVYTLNMTSVSGTFVAGETITIGGETATVVSGGTTSISFTEPTGINFFNGSSVTGGTSGATGTVNTVSESFVGVDKSLKGQKMINDALMTEIKALKGTRFWWEAGQSISGLNEDRSAYLRSSEEVVWTGTELQFTQDIVLEIINTASGVTSTHMIPAAASPIAIANGESVWVNVNKAATSETLTVNKSNTTAIPPLSNAFKDVFVFFKRIDAGGAGYLHLPFTKQLITEGQSVRLGASGSGSGSSVKATFLDPLSTTLPTGATITIDGVAGANNDLVLFTNLASNNNRVYKLGGIGTSITWTAQRSFSGAFSPTDGDSVRVAKGNSFADQLAVFDSINFKVNDTIRLFNGVGSDYWEMGSIKTVALTNNTIDGQVFSVSLTGSESWIVNYSVTRGTGFSETGQLLITSDGTSAHVARGNAYVGDVGVDFNVDINAGNIRLLYTTTNTGTNAAMKLFVMRWSTGAGGPGGVPNYGTAPTSSVAAAGAVGDVQYKGSSGNLDADDDFKWDATENAINLNGLYIKKLQGPVSLLDNQVSAQSAFTFPKLNTAMIVEYSLTRDTTSQVGRLMITNNGTLVTMSDTFDNIGVPGVTFSVIVSGSDIIVQYATTNTGFNAALKYSMRYWS